MGQSGLTVIMQHTGLYSTQMPANDEKIKLDLALECLAESGNLRLRVTGASMLPQIRPGSNVLIRRAAAAEMKPGDVVLARAGDGVRLHRLVEVQDTGTERLWITRGDNHAHLDPPMKCEQLLGVLAHVERQGSRRWFRFLRRIP